MRRAEPPRLPGASPLSIHAPLAGCDHPGPAIVNSFSEFQSTHPLRGATSVILIISRLLQISIHAPLAGCDGSTMSLGGDAGDFNPRTPCGVRQCIFERLLHPMYFNPRTPCGVRQTFRRYIAEIPNFNPRTPCGVRPLRGSGSSQSQRFQSTHPLRGATHIILNHYPGETISIHAPLAGCDNQSSCISCGCVISIHAPLAGCDRGSGSRAPTITISIHAPLAGCDGC